MSRELRRLRWRRIMDQEVGCLPLFRVLRYGHCHESLFSPFQPPRRGQLASLYIRCQLSSQQIVRHPHTRRVTTRSIASDFQPEYWTHMHITLLIQERSSSGSLHSRSARDTIGGASSCDRLNTEVHNPVFRTDLISTETLLPPPDWGYSYSQATSSLYRPRSVRIQYNPSHSSHPVPPSF